MRFDVSLLIFVFDIRCFDIKPKTCIDLDITTSVNCSHQHLYQLTIKLFKNIDIRYRDLVFTAYKTVNCTVWIVYDV